MTQQNNPENLPPKKKIGAWILASTVSLGALLCVIAILIFLTSCSAPNSTAAKQRLFAPIKLDYLGEYQLPKGLQIEDTPVGGLSGLTYDRQRDVFYAVSDDRSNYAPARFYTLKLELNKTNPQQVKLDRVRVTDVTLLKNEAGKTYPPGSIDPEAIAVTPQGTVWISSEGDRNAGVLPFIKEFDLNSGKVKQALPIPQRYLFDKEGKSGIQNNLAFEGMTLSPAGTLPTSAEPLHLFAATESALIQDKETPQVDKNGKIPGAKNRWLHYLISDRPMVVSEYLYQLNPPPSGAIEHGLPEIQAIDNSGHFLTLERSFGFLGFSVKIFQATTGTATDTSKIPSLKGNTSKAQPIQKQLLLDLKKLGIYLDNLEGMALGPRLPDGSQALLLVSDNNFKQRQITQFLLFKANLNPPQP
jgi:hypothetical protein